MAWDEPPILDGASVQRRIKGRDYGLYFNGPKLHMIAFQRERQLLLRHQHAPEPHVERDDARDREGPEAPRRTLSFENEGTTRRHRRWLGRTRDRGLLRRSRPRGRRSRRRARARSPSSRPDGCRSTSPASQSFSPQTASASATRSTWRTSSSAHGSRSSASTRRLPIPAMPTCQPCLERVVDELPDLGERIDARHEEHRSGRDGRARAGARSTGCGLAHVGYVSNPEFLAKAAVSTTSDSPDRVVIGAFAEEDADAVAALYDVCRGAHSCGRTSRRRKWSRWPRTRSSPRASVSSTRSPTSAR